MICVDRMCCTHAKRRWEDSVGEHITRICCHCGTESTHTLKRIGTGMPMPRRNIKHGPFLPEDVS